MMRRHRSRLITPLLALTLLCSIPAQAAADTRLIVRTSTLLDDLTLLKSACRLVGCNVLYGIDGTLHELFLLNVPSPLDAGIVIQLLQVVPGIVTIERDVTVFTEGASAGDASAPPAL